MILSYRSTAFVQALGVGLVWGQPMRGAKRPRTDMILHLNRGVLGRWHFVSSPDHTQRPERRALFGYGCA